LSRPLEGAGIHGGRTSRVWLHREPGPLRFRVGDATIVADLSHVGDTERCTVLGGGGARVAVVEHLLAACHALGFWSQLLIEVDGDELPILDGSAAPWAEALGDLGSPPRPPAPWTVERAIHWRSGADGASSEIDIVPGDATLEVSIAFEHPAIGRQRWLGEPSDYRDLVSARTFGFAQELAALQARGLAVGARQGSGILFTDGGTSGPLRAPDEPVRHKALDAVGDLTLLGRPLGGRVRIHRGSHRAHVSAMRHFLASHPPPRPESET
jgi:UDP-3-O-[3-hydroxymyristoyl] N-acetylglucosamine deacetylase